LAAAFLRLLARLLAALALLARLVSALVLLVGHRFLL
jgi:hypothetical protein